MSPSSASHAELSKRFSIYKLYQKEELDFSELSHRKENNKIV